jgi:hypothetical protein
LCMRTFIQSSYSFKCLTKKDCHLMIVVAEKSSIFGIEQSAKRPCHDQNVPFWQNKLDFTRKPCSCYLFLYTFIGASGQTLVEFKFLKGPEHALSLL